MILRYNRNRSCDGTSPLALSALMHLPVTVILRMPMLIAMLLMLALMNGHSALSQDILCPGMPDGAYCDCEGDCTNHSEYCECEEAQKCCGTFDSDSDSDSSDIDDWEWPDSPFEVFDVDLSEGGCDVPNNKAKKMKKAGFIKVACPFGVLIAGTEEYNDEFLLFGANVLANILDQDSDGIADDPAVIKKLTYKKGKKKGALLACGISEEQESRGEELRDDVFDYHFRCQTWQGWDAAREFKGIMMEEAFHLVHQNGYAVVYPDELGMNDFTSSVVSRETARLQCVEPGYFHPENECPSDSPRPPGNPASSPLEGDCNEASCDVSEFYKMALFLAIGMGPTNDPSGPSVWTSDYMPTAQDEVLEMLSDEFKKMIANPDLHQLTAPITGEYSVANCEDSPHPAYVGKKKRSCDWIVQKKGCTNAKYWRHCRASCGKCNDDKCVDSKLKFKVKWDDSNNELEDLKRKTNCEKVKTGELCPYAEGLSLTCPKTCGGCEE